MIDYLPMVVTVTRLMLMGIGIISVIIMAVIFIMLLFYRGKSPYIDDDVSDKHKLRPTKCGRSKTKKRKDHESRT